VVEQSNQCRTPLIFAFERARLLGGVRPQQVVERVPCRHVFGHQLRTGQLHKPQLRLFDRRPGQARRCGHANVRPRVRTQQPEQACGLNTKAPVRPGKHRPNIGEYVGGVERIQPAVNIA
jgi:hypothetical protein